MSIFKKNNNDDYTIIIGCGRLGSNIANKLSNDGENVLIIDESQDAFKRLSSNFGGLTIVGDGTYLDILKEANITKATTLLAVTNNDNVNVMLALMAKELFNVSKVITRLYDLDRQVVLNGFDVKIICPAMLSVNEINTLINDKGETAYEKE